MYVSAGLGSTWPRLGRVKSHRSLLRVSVALWRRGFALVVAIASDEVPKYRTGRCDAGMNMPIERVVDVEEEVARCQDKELATRTRQRV